MAPRNPGLRFWGKGQWSQTKYCSRNRAQIQVVTIRRRARSESRREAYTACLQHYRWAGCSFCSVEVGFRLWGTGNGPQAMAPRNPGLRFWGKGQWSQFRLRFQGTRGIYLGAKGQWSPSIAPEASSSVEWAKAQVLSTSSTGIGPQAKAPRNPGLWSWGRDNGPKPG